MKNVSSCVWLTMFALLGPLVMPIQARNCPNIPQEMTEITVKSNQAILRTEPSSEINQGVSIEEGSKLKVIEHTPKQEQSEANTDYCWYLVSQIDDPETYYIADSDIQEFVSLKNESTESPSPISSPSPSSSESPIPTPSPSPSSNINIKRLESKLDGISDDLTKVSKSSNDKIEKIESQLGVISDNLTQLLSTNSEPESWSTLVEIVIILVVIGCLEGLLILIIGYLYFNAQRRLTKKVNAEIVEIIEQKTQDLLTKISSLPQNIISSSDNALFLSPQLQEVIDRFNYQRPELFHDFEATPLTLTQDAIQGKVGINARRILQLEIPADPSQAPYLKFDLDQTAWLIPNIKSPYISKIMRLLSENPEVFVINPGSDILQLVKPAKLKETSSGLWEIEEPGIFCQGHQESNNPANSLELSPLLYTIQGNLNQCLEQLQILGQNNQTNFTFLQKRLEIVENTMIAQETHDLAKTLDLPILLYLRKNGHASFQDLLNNVHGNEENLIERLTALQEEDLIQITDPSDLHNSNYSL